MACSREELALPEPSAAVLDAQSTRSSPQGGNSSGYDAGKKVKGRKRTTWWSTRIGATMSQRL